MKEAEKEFLKWTEQALQPGACEAASVCRGAAVGVWYVVTRCEHGHKSKAFVCCSACGHDLVGRMDLRCKDCGGEVGNKGVLILAKVVGVGMHLTYFAAGLKEVAE